MKTSGMKKKQGIEKRDFRSLVDDYIDTIERFFSQKGAALEAVALRSIECLKKGGKILVFGNGGSASQAQHFASELVNRFYRTRKPIEAVALTTDTSLLTSIGNDTGFENIFSRQVDALGRKGDMAFALSTSGRSANIIEALKMARRKKMVTVALTGSGGGKAAAIADYLIDVPSRDTPRIQEVHLIILHLLARDIENSLETS